jgi:ATP-dependent Zn protease
VNNPLVDILINWFPMLLLLGVWLFFIRRMSTGTKYQQDCMDLTRRQVEALERIVVLLEKK